MKIKSQRERRSWKPFTKWIYYTTTKNVTKGYNKKQRKKKKKNSCYLILIDERWCVRKEYELGAVYTNLKRKCLTSRRRLLWNWTGLQSFCVVWAQSRSVGTKCEMKIKTKTGLLGFVWSKSTMKILNKGTELRTSTLGFEFHYGLTIGMEYSGTDVFQYTVSRLRNRYIYTQVYVIYKFITLYFIISN